MTILDYLLEATAKQETKTFLESSPLSPLLPQKARDPESEAAATAGALAEIGAVCTAVPDFLRETPRPESSAKTVACCGSPYCAGCYVVDLKTGAKIHPPTRGEDYRVWLERWEGKGKPQ
jgi:hypothetical protein